MLHENIDEDLYEISDRIRNNLLENAITAEISYRLKDPYSILKKMIRKNIDIQDLTDLIAFRIIVLTQDNCYKALDVVYNTYNTTPEKFKDFIIKPKSNGYQALHTVIAVCQPKRNIELQIRTKQMHDIAESGEANHFRYKNEQEEKIRALFDSMLDKLTIHKAYNIFKQFNWTEYALNAYEQEIQNIWWYYQADLASIQNQFVD